MSFSARRRVVIAAVLLPWFLASCTSGPAATPGRASPSPTAADRSTAASWLAAPSPAFSSPLVATSASFVPTTSPETRPPILPSTTASLPSSPSTTAIPAAQIITVPANGADRASPTKPVTVQARNGTLSRVTMTNPDGRSVKGAMSPDRTAWTSAEPLGYGRKYTVTAVAVNPGAPGTTSTTSFTTLAPARTIYPSFFPNPTMKTVGVGQPMVVIFDKAPADRTAAERALTVQTVPAVAGSWFWWDERTVHYRPQHYWKAGTRITVSANLYGVDLGGGSYGETDRTMTVTVGPSKVAIVDDATKQMQVFVDGTKVRTFAVSMGMDKQVTVDGRTISFVTPSGTYVGQEKYEVKQMSSATYGLPVASSLGYDSKIPLAVRFSNEGIFVHAAPWSVADQGVRNVSHGCINLSPSAGRWFYDNFGYGDVMTVKGTSTELAPTDGFGDWNISWDRWQAGSALA